MKVLVVGAQEDSLGEAVVREVNAQGWTPWSAGISGEEIFLDLVDHSQGYLSQVLAQLNPDAVVCTVGYNQPRGEDVAWWYSRHLEVNVTGPMRLLHAWVDMARQVKEDRGLLRHYVVIGSNSARVPRQGSSAYCAAKAALAQGIRCVARELNGGDDCGIIAYGYEPGLLRGTPMTKEVARRFANMPLTRMRGSLASKGLSRSALAEMMVSNLGLASGPALNGTMIPFDAGEV